MHSSPRFAGGGVLGTQEAGGGRAMATMSYEQMLRTLGGYFRHAGIEQAVITVSDAGADVAEVGGAYGQHWSLTALQSEARQQRGLRGLLRETFQNPWQVTQALRLVGSDLDQAGGGPYTATMTANCIRVCGSDGYERLYWWPTIEQRTVARMTLRHEDDCREIA
jgi:hypothetical protein